MSGPRAGGRRGALQQKERTVVAVVFAKQAGAALLAEC